MAKPLRALCIALAVVLALGLCAWLLLRTPAKTDKDGAAPALVSKTAAEVAEVAVENTAGSYTATQRDGVVTVGDLPASVLNTEYAGLLMDECSSITYDEVANDKPDDLSLYGLAQPEATVRITYTDGSHFTLLVGKEEPVSGGRYCKSADDGRVLLFKRGRTVRFTMPIEKYINYVIIPPTDSKALVDCVGDFTFSGTALPAPVVLRRIDTDTDAALRREAVSFGAVSHLIVSPGLHEADQSYLAKVFDGLLGLLSEGVVDYNCSEADLAQYPLDAPLLRLEFDYRTTPSGAYSHYDLRYALLDDGTPVVTCNGSGVVYKVLGDLAWQSVSYEQLILRWFLSPLITDVAGITLTVDGKTYDFVLGGTNAKDLTATCNGQPVDTEQFRRWYTLLVSAGSEGSALTDAGTPAGTPRLTIRYRYRDTAKADDLLSAWDYTTRRLLVGVNGSCEFAMRDKFPAAIAAGTEALLSGGTVSTDW